MYICFNCAGSHLHNLLKIFTHSWTLQVSRRVHGGRTYWLYAMFVPCNSRQNLYFIHGEKMNQNMFVRSNWCWSIKLPNGGELLKFYNRFEVPIFYHTALNICSSCCTLFGHLKWAANTKCRHAGQMECVFDGARNQSAHTILLLMDIRIFIDIFSVRLGKHFV